jgi:hypothetical protein
LQREEMLGSVISFQGPNDLFGGWGGSDIADRVSCS